MIPWDSPNDEMGEAELVQPYKQTESKIEVRGKRFRAIGKIKPVWLWEYSDTEIGNHPLPIREMKLPDVH